MSASQPRLLQSPGDDVAEFRLSWAFPASAAARFTKNYALACFDRAEKPQETGRANDHVRCQYRRGCQPDARAAASVGRRPHLYAVSAGRKPAADRCRYEL